MRADRLFAPFEGTRDGRPLALFRIAFFGALALHFFPALIHLDDGYARGALRTEEWNHWLYVHFGHYSHAELRAASVITMLGCVMGIVGLRPRIGAIVCGVGFYVFASFNGLHVQTLALLDAWGILLLWMICGGGSAVWSVDAVLRRWWARRRGGAGAAAAAPPAESRLLPALIVFQILLAVFFAGVEKVIAGWPGTNEMGIVLAYPKGFMVRDWVAAWPWLHSAPITVFLTWATLAIELGAPFLLLWRRTRVWALLAFEAFFLGIIAMLEVPPLFYLMFSGSALLVLGDDQVAWVAARLRRQPAPAGAGPAGDQPPPATAAPAPRSKPGKRSGKRRKRR